jgi:hypothetical protein
MKNDLNKLILKLIRKPFAHLNLPVQKNLAELIVALFHNNSFTLREISNHLNGESNVKHKLKRLIYFLDSLEINTAFWLSYVKTIFCLPYFRLKSRKHITILIDATTLKEHVWILAASISYQGRSIPIFLKTWRGVNEPYNYWSRVETFLFELKGLLPKKYKYVLIADRGFQGIKMYEIIKKISWDYVIRINNYFLIRLKNGETLIQLSLFDDGFFEDTSLGKINPMDTNIAINSKTNEEGKKSKWYLMTSLDSKETAVSEYERRMWIEETFKDLKSELKWESYTDKVPTNNRLEKCVIVSCLSYSIRLCIGLNIQIPKSEEAKTSIFKRAQNAINAQSRNVLFILSTIITNLLVNYHKFTFAFS